MQYFVSENQLFFEKELLSQTRLSIQDSLDIIKTWEYIQFDLETSGNDAHISDILIMSFGNIDKTMQIMVDCATIDPKLYKGILEDPNKLIIGQNLKFDFQFLYKHKITPINCYDTMIVEQFLHLGYPYFLVGVPEHYIEEYCEFTESYPGFEDLKPDVKKEVLFINIPEAAKYIYEHSGSSLKALAWRYCNIYLDKTVRGEINWRGIDDVVLNYAAGDVTWLYDIMMQQVAKCRERKCLNGAHLECAFVPVIAYLEWCGIKLDQNKWKAKMQQDTNTKKIFRNILNDFIISNCQNKKTFISYIRLSNRESDEDIEKERKLYKNEIRKTELDIYEDSVLTYEAYEIKTDIKLPSSYIEVNYQGDLFNGFNTEPQCIINWDSSQQVIPVLNILGFNTKILDKKSGEEKESALEKVLSKQKGINDIFLNIYLNYKEADKVCTTYGQTYLNAINPLTERIHTNFKQIGTTSGRMSCGSKEINIALAKLKHLPTSTKNNNLKVSYPQLQNLPATEQTRSCFVSKKGNKFASGDYNALESRLGADIYNEPAMIEEYLYGSGDIHSLVAKACFPQELADVPVKEIKKKRPDLRKKAKAPEFAKQFGGGAFSISESLGISIEEAQKIEQSYDESFKGITTYAKKALDLIKQNGYILIHPLTGHKVYWYEYKMWKKRQSSFDESFMQYYKKLKNSLTPEEFNKTKEKKVLSKHYKIISKWGRLGLNSPTQGE